ncbi:MAG: hypothetical protein GX458_02650, partial [Phyllobacteriaceae bacterium]|nr:hypothetical protein [Phyllobacteriaceae bacterium]
MSATTRDRPISPAEPAASCLRRAILRRLSWLPVAGIVAVSAIVVPAVVGARVGFHLRHPDADPSIYLTISRAISDPVIGEPFAFWVTLAALILWPSTHAILWMLSAEHPSRAVLGATRDHLCRLLLAVMSVAMTATCVGMVMLGRHRLGGSAEDHHLHMLGSYVFFAGQATTILLAAIYHSAIVPARRALGETAIVSARSRARLGYAVVGAAVLYGVVFHVK